MKEHATRAITIAMYFFKTIGSSATMKELSELRRKNI